MCLASWVVDARTHCKVCCSSRARRVWRARAARVLRVLRALRALRALCALRALRALRARLEAILELSRAIVEHLWN